MPTRPRKTATPKVDETVVNQENPIASEEARESTDSASPEVVKNVKANPVDETVVNQENPVTSEKQRESTDVEAGPDEYVKNVEANLVDETVVNQENPGGATIVDRQPEPVIVEDSAGIQYDVSKPSPQLVQPEDDPEEQARKAAVRQNESVLDAKDVYPEEDNDREYIVIVFVESGLTAARKVWKAGETLKLEDNEQARYAHSDLNGDAWYDLSAEEQKDRFGRVMFEKR